MGLFMGEILFCFYGYLDFSLNLVIIVILVNNFMISYSVVFVD